MGTHGHRVMHALWHLMRTALTAEEVDEITQGVWSSMGQPAYDVPDGDECGGCELQSLRRRLSLHAPEDGLRHAERADQRGPSCIGPWSTLPVDNDPVWPVPDANGQGVKSDAALQTMQNWEAAFDDPKWLTHPQSSRR